VADLLKLLGAPVAGAAALLFCALALGIDPLVSAIVGALVWAGVQLLWEPGPAATNGERRTPPTPGQKRQLDAARERVGAIDRLRGAMTSAPIADRLGAIARHAEAMIARLRSDASGFALYRKPLGNYLAQVLDLAHRVGDAERSGRADPAMLARVEATLGRLDALFRAVDERGAALDRLDLDARIAVLEAEIDADRAAAEAGRTEPTD
jgi:hypothetical protein